MAGITWPINIHFLDPSPFIAERDIDMLNRMIDQYPRTETDKTLSDIPTFMSFFALFFRATALGFYTTMHFDALG
ncbi:hypothetical protein MMC14_006682 [Varicellaria rhodocarpa]|nr:hypothetical protein [Varicellaria rhodocarpa]